MCVLTLSITFARLSKACFDPEREIFKSDGLSYNYCGEPVVFTIKRAVSNRSGKWTVIPCILLQLKHKNWKLV
jgi:hypothetical protein